MQVDSQFELSSAELRKVDRVRFGILSPDEIKAMSVCEIQTPFTYDNAIPKDGGLLDLRMGTMERNIRCKSCNGDMKSCPGHFGHIELVKPCLHIGLMPIIAKILKCVCFYCSSLLLAPDNPKYHHTMRIKKPAKRLQAMLKICQSMKKCNGGFDVDASAIAEDNERERNGMMDGEVRKPKSSGCGNILPRYKVESGYEVLIEFPEDADAMLEGSVDRKKPLSATRIHEIFKRISDDDVRALGFDPQFARPDWFVLTVLAVPPPPVRPSVMFASSARSSDDLTYKLADIVKANQALKTQELQGAAEHILLDYTRLLQWHVATLMDNEISGQPQSFQRSGKPIKSIRQRIVGKGGRVRGNLMGKRVDFSARSVITPDPNLGIDQLGVPRTIAMNMTYPEIVTRFNIARMRQLVINGPNIHPGAKTIIRDDGRQIDLRYIKKNSDLHLEIGYKVERHIVDGDPVIFNRQPSLHKMSMMGHKVRVFPWSTFRLNLSCTTPYNADFDGDEMNMHVPQTYGTRAEVLNIILSPRQVVSPQANKPVMGIVQDTLLGVMKFTFRDNFITRDLTFNILMCLDSWDGRLPVPAILKPQPMWTGKQLFSCLLPKINMAHTCFPADDHRVLTNHGFLFLDQVKAMQAQGESVTFACYDKATQAMVYRPALKLNENAYEGELLDFTTDKERRAWGVDSTPYGAPVREAVCETDSNHLSVRVTPNHKMFVQFGETTTSGSVQWYGTSPSELCDYVKQRADQLVASNDKPIPRELQTRGNGRAKPDSIRMLAVATAGVGEVDGIAACAALSSSLGLLSADQVEGFLQLYGFWLGAGSMQYRTATGDQDAVLFGQVKSADKAFMDAMLPRAGLTPADYTSFDTASGKKHWIITKDSWVRYFDAEYGRKSSFSSAAGGSALAVSVSRDADKSAKWFAPFVRLCTRGQLRLIVEGLHRADGAPDGGAVSRAKVILTSSVRFRDELLDLLLRAGFSTYFTSHRKTGDRCGTNNHDDWAVHWCEEGAAATGQLNHLSMPRAQIATEKFRGTVWCPEVDHPDHLIVVQRAHRAAPGMPVTKASKPVIAGNSNNHPDNEEGIMSVGDTLVLVEMGELIQGTVDKRTVGNAQGSLIHLIWVEYGPFRCAQFFTEVQKMVNHWLINNGFSIGIGDAVATSSVLAEIENTITSAKTEVSNIINRARAGKLERTPGRTVNETFEGEVNGVLNKATDACGKLVKKALLHTNNVNAMVSAGSKGNAINICQIIACVGQQNVSGKRIPFGFRNRSLPHFNKYDLGPESKGFVENSYLKGLTPQEFFFHAMGGREGLVDTAVKTAETGYIQRRLVKAMEDVMVQYDASVRNALGEIIQFVYGEDGMDGCFIEKQKLDSAKMDDDKLRSTYNIDLSNPDSLDSWLAPDIKEALLRDRDAHSKLSEEYEAIMGDRAMLRARVLKIGDDAVYLPVNLKRLIWNAQKRFRVEGSGSSNVRSSLSPTYIIDNLRNMCDRLVVIRGGDDLSKEAQINATLLFKTMLRSTFAAKRVIKDYNLSKDAFTWLLGEIEARFHQALAHPGEMIGSIAAQSIGEPATQMTLNTFHYAGVSSKNVTLGVPRLREIIDVAASCKTPSLTVYLKSASAFDADAAKTVLNKLEFTTLKSVTERTEIYYDPTPENSCVEEDRDFLQFYFEIPDDDFSMESASPWMLRIVLDRKKKESKELTNADIANHINAEWRGDLKAIFSNDNAAKLVLQIRFKNDEVNDKDANGGAEESNDDDVFLRKVEESLLNTMELRGIKGISKVFLRQEKVAKFSPAGKFTKEQEEWVLDTEGVALLRVMCVEEVDHTQCNSNVVTEMFDVLGIEAARASLLKELRAVIEFDGAYVNYRHLATLCDSMSFRGHLMSINRHGINRSDSGALMRCSFEETVEILVQAAAFSELDTMRGVSENIMLGNLAPLGTNSFKLFLNQPMLERYAIDEPDHAKLFSSMYAMDGLTDPNMPMQASTPLQNFGGSMSPSGSFSPSGGAFSPAQGAFSPGMAYSPSSPGAANFSPTSPSYSPTSPNAGYAGGGGASYSPTSPSYSPTSPGAQHGASYSPTSPSYSPTSPSFHNTSPSYSPTSPSYSPTSPGHGGGGASYSPTSPSYSPTSPQRGGGGGGASYSPTSPSYSPTSPGHGGGGASYSPTSPSYSPTSPNRGGGASYSPTSPSYSPTSPNAGGGADASYSPTSPSYSPTSPAHNYSPTSPSYSPTSPSYSPDSAKEERKTR